MTLYRSRLGAGICMMDPHMVHWWETISGSVDCGSSKSSMVSCEIDQPMSCGAVVSLSSRIRLCRSLFLILILRPFLGFCFGACFFLALVGGLRGFCFGGSIGGFDGGAFFLAGGGAGAFFLVLGNDFLSFAANSKSSASTAAAICFLMSAVDGGLGAGGAFLPFGGGGGGAFFAMPNTPCKH